MISAVVLTKNEEKNIKDCLQSLSFCDEVIVIDDESSDQTVKIAKPYGAKVFTRALDGDFSAQRNFGLHKAKGEWVLFIDADERISKELQKEMLNGISSQNLLSLKMCGFDIVRRDILWGRELRYGEVGSAKRIRLARSLAGRWEGKVHEKWMVKGKIGSLNSFLLHYPHQTVSEFLKDINFYTTLRAKELYDRDKKTNFLEIAFYPVFKFVQNYMLARGFLDGTAGFIVAMLMSFHSFLVRGKLWLLWHRERK